MFKKAIVAGLDLSCGLLDRIPRYENRRWYSHGFWGCQFGLATWSYRLELKWETGWWKLNEDESA